MKISYATMAQKFNLSDFLPEQGVAPVHYTWKFSLSASAAELWPYIADTSSFNRFIGLSARTETEKHGQKWVKTTVFGFEQEWVEEPWTWIQGRSLEFVRHYTRGITRSMRSNMILEPTEAGVDLYVSFVWIPQSLPLRMFLQVTDQVIHANFQKALSKIEASLKTKKDRSFHALKMANDPRENVNLPELEKIAEKLKSQKILPQAVDGLVEFIKLGDEADLYRIRAIELADALKLKKRDVISACMQGVREGLLTISWDVICPHCRGVRLEAKNLGDIPANSDCLVCEVDFETDTLESIEVTFHVHPSFRKINPVVFCTAEPAKKDHVQVQHLIPPKGQFRFQLHLKEGRHRIRVKNEPSAFFFEANHELPDAVIHWQPGANAERILCGTSAEFVLENATNEPKSFTLEQLWWKDNILHPADIFAIQEYQDIFSRESLKSQVRMSLGIQTIMFTDIVNSTGFYSTRGDAAAFSDVRKHFTELFEVIAKHEGTVIKTIGDSVMACFLNPDNALKASLQIQERFKSDREDMPIRLRISMHIGQVIAVHLNQGLDLFGNSVNKAAKLQSCAGAGEIAVSAEFFQTCSQSLPSIYKAHVQKRTSHVQYKELPLEAEVIKVHEALTLQKTSQRIA